MPTEGVEPTHPYGYQILSLARLPIPPHRLPINWVKIQQREGEVQASGFAHLGWNLLPDELFSNFYKSGQCSEAGQG